LIPILFSHRWKLESFDFEAHHGLQWRLADRLATSRLSPRVLDRLDLAFDTLSALDEEQRQQLLGDLVVQFARL
jgi:hypothetical protein